MEALSAQSPELRQLPKKSGQIIGSQRVGAAARHVIFKAGDELVLQLLHTSWLLKTMSVSDYDQGGEAGEGGDIQLHAMEGLRKLQDGVNPVTKASDTLHFVKNSPIAEDELVRFRIGTIRKTQDEEFNKRRFQQQLLVFCAELRETWDALCPLPDDLHGGSE